MNMEAAGFSQTSVFTVLHCIISQTIASLVSDILIWAVNTVGAGQKSNTHKVVVGKGERKDTLCKAGCKGKNNVKMDFVVSWLEWNFISFRTGTSGTCMSVLPCSFGFNKKY